MRQKLNYLIEPEPVRALESGLMKLPRHDAVPVDASLLAALQATANAAVDAAAEVTLAWFRQPLAVDNKAAGQHFDPVTQADRGAEEVIRKVVLERFPEHAFLGEESGSHRAGDALTWVVDPIDGTRAFITGSPLWGTLVAVYDGEQVVLGVFDQPFLAERLEGLPDRTTLRDRHGTRVLHSRSDVQLAAAHLQTTAPELFDTPARASAFERLRSRVRLTRFGGDCYSYALLAMGHVDIVVDCGLQPYDIQALIPIVEGAGGRVTDWQGQSAVAGGEVVATANPQLHDDVLRCLAEPL